MMIGRLFPLLLSLAVGLAATAQTSMTVASRDAMLYEVSCHLYEKGDTLTSVSMDMEWPEGLNGSVLPELQHCLTAFFFGQPSAGYREGWRNFQLRRGKEIRTMKDDRASVRRYCDMKLHCLWLEPGRYISFLACLEERGEQSVIASRHLYFTFDLIHQKILTQRDVFNQERLWRNAGIRYQFCEVLDTTSNAPLTDTVDWEHLPGQFALEGAYVRFDLGTDSVGGTYSLVSSEVIDVLFSRNFRRWLRQPLPAAGTAHLPDEAVYAALPADSVFPETMPRFEGNISEAVGQNLFYSDNHRESTPRGKVIVSFVVDVDGSLKDMVFLTVGNVVLNRAVAAALRSIHGWKPAMLHGRPVACRYNLPFIFCFR